jgi:hypothetical protein|tara:strand:- start:633 stop:851 length:219 start_codon:yes stop_codon:yes gene_type:complete
MIHWDNAPEYSRKGYVYKPEIHEDEEGIRKASHRCVNRIDPTDVMIAPDLPYDWMTQERFNEFVDMMVRVRS